MAPSDSILTAFSALQDANLGLAALAGLRSVLTVVTAILTWLTVWHFSATPFPLYYGWTFAMIYMTIGGATAVACAAPTTHVVLQLWHWGSARSNSMDNRRLPPCATAVATQPTDSLQQLQVEQQCGSQDIQLHNGKRRCCLAPRLPRLVAAIVALLALFIVCLVVHGGSVAADWHLIKCYLARRSATGAQAQRSAQQQLRQAQQCATECSVTLALLFIAPSVAIKWSLIVYLGDFSWLPVLSTVLSSIACAALLSFFFSMTFIYGKGWTWRQRAVGIVSVAAAVLSQLLWRLAATSFLLLKFGGEAFMFWVLFSHPQAVITIFVRSKQNRRAYQEAFKSNKLQVFLLSMCGAVALVYDVPSLYQGLKSRKDASRPTWPKQVFFGASSLCVLASRLVEGVVTYIVVLTVHPQIPCDNHLAPVDSWHKVCAAELDHWFYFWRARCWGCSMFDRYYVLGQMQEKQLLVACMLGTAAVILLVMLCALCTLWRLLPRCHDQQQTYAHTASEQQSPFETAAAKSHPLIETRYDYALEGSVVDDSQCVGSVATIALLRMAPASGSSIDTRPQGTLLPSFYSLNCASHHSLAQSDRSCGFSTHPLLQGGSTSDASCQPYVRQLQEHVMGRNASSDALLPGPCASVTRSPGCASACGRNHLKTGTRHTAMSMEQQAHPFSSSGQLPTTQGVKMPGLRSVGGFSSAIAASQQDHPSSRSLILQLVAMLALLPASDVVVFNSHWILQLALLIVGVIHCLWLHVGCLFRTADSHKPSSACQ